MADERICRICNEKIEFPKDKDQNAHEICVYAERTAPTFKNLKKSHHKSNLLLLLNRLSSGIAGMKCDVQNLGSEEEIRDDIILYFDQIKELLEEKFKIDLSENKTDILNNRFELLQPFLRLEMVFGDMFGRKKLPYTILKINNVSYNGARRNLVMPESWDKKLRQLGVNPAFIRTGNGNVYLSDVED